jgi:hypothetical protein
MDTDRHLLTIRINGVRYRGAYSLERERLIVEAHGLGRTEVDASLVDGALGEPARKLATIIFTQLIRENSGRNDDVMNLVAQGSTTQVTVVGQQL